MMPLTVRVNLPTSSNLILELQQMCPGVYLSGDLRICQVYSDTTPTEDGF